MIRERICCASSSAAASATSCTTRSRPSKTAAHELAQLLPEARIAVAHGQMPERELERVMRDFVLSAATCCCAPPLLKRHRRCPTANTIVIARADKFGLAQLHQLRGRVSAQPPPSLRLPAGTRHAQPDAPGPAAAGGHHADGRAGQRLFSGHARPGNPRRGRGAGENQSGMHVEIGFQLYNDMLSEAVRCLKSGQERTCSAHWPSPPKSTCTPQRFCPLTIVATCICA